MAACTALGILLYAMRLDIASQGIGVVLSDFVASVIDNTGYPIAIESEPVQLTASGKRAVLVTENALMVCNSAGHTVIEERLEGQNAIAVSAGRYLLCYLRGGYELWLRSGETVLFHQRFDQPIYTAALAANGAVAVSIGAVGDQSQVIVYDSSFEECLVWMSSGRAIHALALNDAGTSLAVGGVEYAGGVLSSAYSVFDIADATAQPRCEVILEDELLLSMALPGDGNALVITDRAAHSIAANGSRRGTYSYEGKPLAAFALDRERGALLALGDYESSHRLDLVRLDLQGRETAAGECDQRVLSLHFSGEEALAFVGERALRYTAALQRRGSVETPEALYCAVVGGQLYYATMDRLDRAPIR